MAAEGGRAPEPMADGEVAVNVTLTDFEGPLDLLLHLVQQHELDILDIPIAFITDRYLSYLSRLQQLNLDVAGEYLVMAATLAWLKSRELVPPSADDQPQALDDEDDGVDPREELIRRLLEYQKYKEVAARLGDRPVVGRNVWLRGSSAATAAGLTSESSTRAPLEEVPVFRLIEAFEKVLSRSRVKLTHDVVVDRISISDRINQLVDRLGREGSFTFGSCFEDLDWGGGNLRQQLVVTFLSILEMTRLRLVRIHQPAHSGEIYLSRTEADLVPGAASGADKEFTG
jgi:segregation and condensation protein A